jgi:hypothetical protein
MMGDNRQPGDDWEIRKEMAPKKPKFDIDDGDYIDAGIPPGDDPPPVPPPDQD